MRAELIDADTFRLYGGGRFDGWTEFSWAYLIEAEPRLASLRAAVRDGSMKVAVAASEASRITGPARLHEDWKIAVVECPSPATRRFESIEKWLETHPMNRRLYGEAFDRGWPAILSLEVSSAA